MYKVCSSIVCLLSRADRVRFSKANMKLLKLFVGCGEGCCFFLFGGFLFCFVFYRSVVPLI